MACGSLLLVNPIQQIEGRRQRGWNGNRFVPPLNLAYVAALTPPDWQIAIVDENAGDDALRFRAFRPDLVAITSYTANIPRAYDLSAHFRAQGIPVVIGGSHASALPHEVIRYADVAFVGQAEGAWPQLLRDWEQGHLECVYDGGMPDLEQLVLPRRDLYPHRYVFDAVVTTQGCPYRCEFCSVWKTYDQRYLKRPVNDVLDELARIEARHLFFMDDNFTADAERAVALCQGMVDRRLNKRFAIQASLDVGQNDELLHWLNAAGCFFISVGLESVHEATLRQIRKASNLRVGVGYLAEAIARIQIHGMAVSASIIFGHDHDTISTFSDLESFVDDSGLDSVVWTILTPLPGTDLWDRLDAEGRLLDLPLPASYTYYDAHHVTFQPQGVTAEQLLASNRAAVCHTASLPALLGGLWRTWRRTGSTLAALAALQNSRWARNNARSSPG